MPALYSSHKYKFRNIDFDYYIIMMTSSHMLGTFKKETKSNRKKQNLKSILVFGHRLGIKTLNITNFKKNPNLLSLIRHYISY